MVDTPKKLLLIRTALRKELFIQTCGPLILKLGNGARLVFPVWIRQNFYQKGKHDLSFSPQLFLLPWFTVSILLCLWNIISCICSDGTLRFLLMVHCIKWNFGKNENLILVRALKSSKMLIALYISFLWCINTSIFHMGINFLMFG